MTDDDPIIEALASRLFATAYWPSMRMPENDRVPEPYRAIMLRQAKECLRQMEWARTSCVGETWEGEAGDRRLVDRSALPVTVAPHGWEKQ